MKKLDFSVSFHTADETRAAATESARSAVYKIHEQRHRLPPKWSKSNKLAANFVLHMGIALAQQNLDVVEKLLRNVSHPESPHYSHHMTSAEIVDMFAPRQETISAVTKWLQDFGIDTTYVRSSASKGWLYFYLTVANAERLLKAKYYAYRHTSGKRYFATEEYSVPATIQPHIDFITPTVHFDAQLNRNQEESNTLKKRSLADVKSGGTGAAKFVKLGNLAPYTNSSNMSELSMCDQVITPMCLRALYNFVNYTQKSSKQNNYGIPEYTPESYVQSDLDLFLGQYNPSAQGAKPIINFIDGAVFDTADTGNFDINGESNLDLQYAIALVDPTPVTLYQTGDLAESSLTSFNNFLDAIDGFYCKFQGGDNPCYDAIYPDPYKNITGAYEGPEDCGKYNATHVISTSYGYNEADLTPAYERRQCLEYAKLGLQGVTVLYASGDDGVAGFGGYCIDPQSGNYTTGPEGIKFNPGFPVNCPYVTAVGATQVNPNSTVYDPESACEQVIYSGGGFSNVFALPDYQAAAVNNFFASHKPPYNSTQYNNSGQARGFPDISANGANYNVAIGGQFLLVYGTSASSPVVGSIVTLINDARLAVSKRPVGFLNPVLYANPQALNDITSGNNPGCRTQGFSAVEGWDPVTGLGTPNFQKLLDVFLSLP